MGSEFQEQATQAQQTVERAAGQAQQQARDLAHQAEQQAKSALSSRKEMAATGLHDVAQAFRQTGDQLSGQNTTAAQYTNQVADQIERLSTYLENQDIDQMVADAEEFARRRPELFIGGALVLGFLGARFLKSSSDRRRAGQWTDSEWRSYPATETVATRNRLETGW